MIKYVYEYRINKKSTECFRTRSLEQARRKLTELNQKRPGIYSMQIRSCRVNKLGILEQTWNGKPAWGIWS